jgi:hypothetical protein
MDTFSNDDDNLSKSVEDESMGDESEISAADTIKDEINAYTYGIEVKPYQTIVVTPHQTPFHSTK